MEIKSVSVSEKNRLKETSDKQVWWVNGAFVVFTHVASIAVIAFYRPAWQSILLMVMTIQFAILGYLLVIDLIIIKIESQWVIIGYGRTDLTKPRFF
jgi:hypothetical protein